MAYSGFAICLNRRNGDSSFCPDRISSEVGSLRRGQHLAEALALLSDAGGPLPTSEKSIRLIDSAKGF